MKNARKMADQVMIDIEKTRHRSDWAIIPIRDIIAKALQAAYQKGAEDMKNKLLPWNYFKRTPEGGGR